MLRECLYSIFENTNDVYEILVISDCDDKHTREFMERIIRKHKNIFYFTQKSPGPAASRNLGIKRSREEIIAFLDDDCVVDKSWIKNILDAHKKNPKILAIAGAIIPRNHSLISEFSQGLEARADTKNNSYFYPSIVNNNSYKKKIFHNMSGFDTSFKRASGEDVEFNYRLDTAGIKTIFRKDIKVYHHYKTQLWPLLKQQFWFGHERLKLMITADDYPFDKSNMSIYYLKRIMTPLVDPWLRLVFAIRQKRKYSLLYLPLGYLQQAAYWSGFISRLFKRLDN